MSVAYYSNLGDWLAGSSPGGIIDLRSMEEIGNDAPPAFGFPLPDFTEISQGVTGSVIDALDPWGIIGAKSSPAQTSQTPGAIATAGAAFGSAFGSMAGIALIIGVAYLIFKAEASR